MLVSYKKIVFIFCFVIHGTVGVYCPHYCRCFMLNGYRHVGCVGRRLISVELDVPRTVQWLQLSNNSIYELRDNVFEDLGLEHIIELNLDNNAIQSIGLNAFSGLSKLKYVDLSGNHLYHLLPGTFENTPSLVYLNLRGNPLRYIRGNEPFLISHSLNTLDISNCRISHIPENAFLALPSLAKLNISSNHIGSIDYYTFGNLSKLQEVDVSQNRLTCDMVAEDLFSSLESKSVQSFGSPCVEKPIIQLPKGPMLEKMIIQNDMVMSENEFDDYVINPQNGCNCNKSTENYENTEFNDEDEKNKNACNTFHNPLFLMLAFVNGLLVGAAFSLSGWICSRWVKARRAQRSLAVYSSIQYDGPPPAYSDLF